MAIGTPTERKAASAAAQLGTTAFSPATTIAVSTVAILCATGNANKTISSVSDSVGNTWHVDATGGDGTRTTSFASAQIATQITSSDTITITWSTATSGAIDYWVQEVTGLATSSVIDKFAANSGTTGAISTGSTGTLSQAAEIAFVLFRTGNASPGAWTKGASWTNPTTPSLSSARSSLEYQIVAATTALNGGGSWATSGNPWAGGIATYKQAATVTSVTLTPATETDSSVALVHIKQKSVTSGTETDTSVDLVHLKQRGVTATAETDSPVALVHVKQKPVTSTTETDSAVALTFAQAQSKTLTPVSETDSAQALSHTRKISLTPAAETDAAIRLALPFHGSVVSVTETDTAVPLVHVKTIIKALTAAAETDAALAITRYKTATVGAVDETDEAQALVSHQAHTVFLDPIIGGHIDMAQHGHVDRAERGLILAAVGGSIDEPDD